MEGWEAGTWGVPILGLFLNPPPLPIKTGAPHGVHPPPPPHLKMKPAPSEKQTLPLKREAPFHEMIPRKSTIYNILKSS